MKIKVTKSSAKPIANPTEISDYKVKNKRKIGSRSRRVVIKNKPGAKSGQAIEEIKEPKVKSEQTLEEVKAEKQQVRAEKQEVKPVRSIRKELYNRRRSFPRGTILPKFVRK